MDTTQPVRRRPRHLMDPANLQRPSVESREITRVQQWVLSVLVTTTILHLAVGLAVAGVLADGSRPGAGVGLNVLAAACGVGAVLAARLIHRRAPLSWWLLLGLVPGLVGLWFVLG
ncbi:MAG TPA: hypothetical protein VH228_15535 [Nocardioides sp.]|nr:hypothetical protein [Nocardioides sp.]